MANISNMRSIRFIKGFLVSLMLLVSFLVMGSCAGRIDIQKSELLSSLDLTGEIICIEPQFFFQEPDVVERIEKSAKINHLLTESIEAYSAKIGLNVRLETLVRAENVQSYSMLQDLKREMLLSNFSQQSELEFEDGANSKSTNQRVFVYPPLISHRYNGLSKIYGTPLFLFIGLFYDSGKLRLLNILVNTDTSETIYKEIKELRSGIKPNFIRQMIFDSLAQLKEEI